jgi:hypothetical protein
MKLKVSRRHLIKGALAAPLVLTVRSAAGTGTALTSAGACRVADKDKYAQGTVKKSIQQGKTLDEWVRKEFQVCKIEEYKNNKWSTLQEDYFMGDSGYYWQIVRSGDNVDVYAKPTYKSPNYRWKSNVRKEYGLVCVDQNGVPKGWVWEKPEYSPVTGSCWASLKVG